MHRRSFRAQSSVLVGVLVGDLGGVDTAHPVGDLLRTGEGGFHRHLLVEQRTYENSERILVLQGFSCRMTGQSQVRHSASLDGAAVRQPTRADWRL